MKEKIRLLENLAELETAMRSLIAANKKKTLTDLEVAGAVKSFEYCYELMWKTLQKLLAALGQPLGNPREVFISAIESKIIPDSNLWMTMIEDRNLTSHTYNHELAGDVVKRVKSNYLPLFLAATKQIKARLSSSF